MGVNLLTSFNNQLLILSLYIFSHLSMCCKNRKDILLQNVLTYFCRFCFSDLQLCICNDVRIPVMIITLTLIMIKTVIGKFPYSLICGRVWIKFFAQKYHKTAAHSVVTHANILKKNWSDKRYRLLANSSKISMINRHADSNIMVDKRISYGKNVSNRKYIIFIHLCHSFYW